MPILKLTERCGRCPREEVVELTPDEAVERIRNPVPREKALVIHIDGSELVSYDFLCEQCRGIVLAYCSGAGKQAKKSARRYKRVRVAAVEGRNAAR